MQLTQEEIQNLQNFINKYNEINNMTDLMQKSIESLVIKRDYLFDELLEMKKSEEIFMSKLIEKYGASEITPNKLLNYLK